MLAAGLSVQAAPMPKSWSQPAGQEAHQEDSGGSEADGGSDVEEAGDSVQELRKRRPCCGMLSG